MTTVRWRNTSNLAHTVTADPALAARPGNAVLPPGASPFDSGTLLPGDTFTRTFDVPGLYRYVCLPHESAPVVGEIEVRQAPSSRLHEACQTSGLKCFTDRPEPGGAA